MVQGLVRYPGAGCVVEFMQGNAPQIAWVLEEQNGRLRLLLPNRRETALQAARILPWPGPAYEKNCSRDAALEILERHKSRREVANVDPLELWELAQGEVEQAPAQWFAELAMSEPDMDAVAACGHALMQAKSHFKFNPPNFEVYPESVVATRMAELEAARRREELVNKGSAFIRLLWEIHQKKSTQSPGRAAESLDPDVRERLRRTIMNRIADPETSEDDGLWKLMVKGLPDDPFMPLYLAQAWGLVEPHHNYWMDRAGYAPGNGWCEEHRDELDALLAQAAEDERQEPTFPDRPIISIDAPTTRDVDDAFFIEARPDGGWNLTLALACPAFRWPFGGKLDKAVFNRATSIYLPEATHHMLPEALGTGAYSLLAQKTRPSLLIECTVGADGLVAACEPRVGYARLAANLCYEDCETALDGGESPASPYLEQLRQALARSLSEQWAMEQERTQALAALAHDLKTPLSIVSGSAELLEEDALSPAQRERVDAILRSAGRIRDYMEQLRALTAAGGPAEVGGRATAELSALAEGWAAAGRGLCAPRGLRFSLDCPASRPCTLFRSELDRAVLNLLDNAAKHGGSGKRIDTAIARDEDQVVITIRDYGPGIPAEELPHVKYKFYKGSSKARGSGIGLAVCDEIITRHEGTLDIDNAEGGGCIVTIHLPIRAQAVIEQKF